MKAAADELADAPRFIVGMPRAATSWLGRCFNEHPQTAVFGESSFWGRRYLAPGPGGTYDGTRLQRALRELEAGSMLGYGRQAGLGSLKNVNIASFPGLLEEAFEDVSEPLSPAAVYLRVTGSIARAEGKRWAIEKTPHHLNWIDRIVAALPQAKLVVMVRDPYGLMLSYKHQGEGRPHRRNPHRYHPFGCALVWRRYMQAAEAAVGRYPEHTLLVRFDELKSDPQTVLDNVQRFWGLDPVDLASRVPPWNTSFPSGRRPDLGGEDLFWMNLLNRRLMRRCHFDLRRVPFRPRRIIGSFLAIPLWAARNLVILHRQTAGSVWRYLWRWVRPRSVSRAGATEGHREEEQEKSSPRRRGDAEKRGETNTEGRGRPISGGG